LPEARKRGCTVILPDDAVTAEELKPGAAERGDALFRTGLAPWCAEIF